jgi:16S rRNA (cytosine967-C5)-methyltransferase
MAHADPGEAGVTGGRPTARAPDARSVAARVLVRTMREGAFAAAALQGELTRARQLDERDRALATELVYGVLRLRPWLEARLGAYAPRGLGKLPPDVHAHLLVAAYQLAATRVPPFAAVSEAVSAVRASKGERVAGFANAVLRKLAQELEGGANLAAAAIASAPSWLRDALARALGDAGASAMLADALSAPPLGLRVDAGTRDAHLANLRKARPAALFEAGRVSPRAILARGAGPPEELPGVAAGELAVQEEGSQVVALALGARPGERVLDACAGRGNKTAILARAVGGGGSPGAADACDLHASKLERLSAELRRGGIEASHTFAVDWTVGVGAVPEGYDRVLVDAPCSGVGTMRRRPDLLLRREPEDLARLAAAQRAILCRAASRVRPGGRVVYAVCSVLREEAEDVVDAFLEGGGFARAPFDADLPVLAGREALRLLPHEHGTDGYYLASLRRLGEAPLPRAPSRR